MSTILCATDLSKAAQPVMGVAAALARALHARLELVHVVHPPGLLPDVLTESVLGDLVDSAATVMEGRAVELRARGLEVGVSVRPGPVDDGIIQRAHEVGAELIVVGTHARHAAGRFFMGSVAER